MAELSRNRGLGRLGDLDLPPLVDGPPSDGPPSPFTTDGGPPSGGTGSQVWITGTGRDRVYSMRTSGKQLRHFDEFDRGIEQFDHPTGIAVAGGRVYVADSGNDRVVVLSTDGQYLDEWEGFDNPHGVAVDSGDAVDPLDDRVYVADTGSGHVQVLSTAGVLQGVWDGSDDVPLVHPRDVAVGNQEGGPPPVGQGPPSGEGAGTVFVTDAAYDRVLVLDLAGTTVDSLGGTNEAASNPTGIDTSFETIWVATSSGVLGYNDSYGRLTSEIRRWGLEIDVRAGRHSGTASAEIPPGLGGGLYLRFRFRNMLADSGRGENPNGPYAGARIDNLEVRCATGDYRTAYRFDSGTSFAAPLVTGVAALYMARYPHATVSDVINALRKGADDRPAVRRIAWGGALDASRTLMVKPR